MKHTSLRWQNKYVMQANTIPGTTATEFGIVIANLQVFYAHAERTVDLVEQRRLWIQKQREPKRTV